MKIYISVLFVFLLFTPSPSWAYAPSESTLPTVEISADQETSIEATHFPLFPLSQTPISANTVDENVKKNANVQRLSDVTRIDASTSDSYNASGYWDFLNVRGYTLDNRFSYLREGLPINAETSLPLDNKKSVEILKGLSGMQVGASSPGGLVNLVVQRPPPVGDFQKILSSVNDEGGYLLGTDVGGRKENFGYRGMLVYEDLKPAIERSQGSRYLVSYAHDYSLNENTLLQFELEHSQRSQPSQAALSLLGNLLPDPSPRMNLNNQPWTTPVVFSAFTATAGVQKHFSENWQGSLIVGIQDLVTDDRLAYPFGCSAENNFDRFCSDGTFDVYDYRSNNEHRRTESAKITFEWQGKTADVNHAAQIGILGSRNRDRFDKQAYNYVGVGNINSTTVLPENGATLDENTNRDASNLDVFIYDAMKYQAWGLWLGGRSTSVDRSSVRTDGSRPSGYNENFFLPWAALSYEFSNALVYASYGEGIETFVTPNRATYDRPGQFVEDVRSRQYELGLRDPDGKSWSLAVFEIHRPVVTDLAPQYQVDGKALHRGLELQLQKDISRSTWGLSLMALEAKREGSTLQNALNGLRPVNVPKNIARAYADYQWSEAFKVSGRVSFEDDRAVTPDNSVLMGAWTRIDAGFGYEPSKNWSSRLFVENIFDRKFWKESPTQYGHIYLYPGMERTFTLDLAYKF